MNDGDCTGRDGLSDTLSRSPGYFIIRRTIDVCVSNGNRDHSFEAIALRGVLRDVDNLFVSSVISENNPFVNGLSQL